MLNVERETFSNEYLNMSSRIHMNPGYVPKHLELTSSYEKGDAISFWYVIDHKNGINKQNVIFIKLENTG